MPQYMLLIYVRPERPRLRPSRHRPRCPKWFAYRRGAAEAGAMLGRRRAPADDAPRRRCASATASTLVTDGPFAETKESSAATT